MTGRRVSRWWWAAAAAGVVFAATRNRYAFGGSPRRAGVNRDPRKLLPGFARRLNLVFARMRARGFDPYLWEGYRTPERAAALAQSGQGIRKSMHVYGAGVDIVSARDLWDASSAFWDALGREAERVGLTWGGRFDDGDQDVAHVQAVPVEEQAAFRAMTRAQRLAHTR